jgi:hypothetical protein
MVTYLFSCLYTKSSYKNVNKKSGVILGAPKFAEQLNEAMSTHVRE